MPSSITYPLTETFMSVQSEGSQAGQPAFFIRFHGCNLDCKFGDGFVCDETLHSKPQYDKVTPLELLIMVRKACTHNVVITGGEPSLNGSIGSLIRYLRHEGYHVAVETNGYKMERLLDANLITYSPKIGHSAGARQIRYAEYQAMGHKDDIELKLLANAENPVDTGRWDDYPLKFVQAINYEHDVCIAAIRYVTDFVAANPEWYMSFQTHKITGAR